MPHLTLLFKDDEGDNTPIAAALTTATKTTSQDEGHKTSAASIITAPLITATQDDEGDNTPIAAASNVKRPALGRRKHKRQLWDYDEPAVDNTSKYWDVAVEGKRTRTLTKASYAEEDARSDSEEDPEDVFKPQREESSSSGSGSEPIAKKLVNLLQRN
jgi:hypothetical protein